MTRLERLLHLPPRWVVLLALAIDIGVAAWRSASASGAHQPGFILLSLIWPGALIFVAVYAFAWLGWALEID